MSKCLSENRRAAGTGRTRPDRRIRMPGAGLHRALNDRPGFDEPFDGASRYRMLKC